MNDLLDRVNCCDCLDPHVGLSSLPPGCVDAVITDPPYGIPAGSAFVRTGDRIIEDWAKEGHNVAPAAWMGSVPFAEDAYCLEFGDRDPKALPEQIARHEAAGLTPWHYVALVKLCPPPTPRPKFATAFELALVSYRGKRPWYGGGAVPDRWIGQTPNQLCRGVHPTQKPLAPLRQWIEALCPPGGTVLDPFMGSGTTAVACIETGRRFIGYEISPDYCAIANKRIAEARARPTLPFTTQEGLATTAMDWDATEHD